MRYGTNRFVSILAAHRYYADYGYDDVEAAVAQKLEDGEIVIGRPVLKEGESFRLIDNGTRYEINDGRL
jgi:hypothetical protein